MWTQLEKTKRRSQNMCETNLAPVRRRPALPCQGVISILFQFSPPWGGVLTHMTDFRVIQTVSILAPVRRRPFFSAVGVWYFVFQFSPPWGGVIRQTRGQIPWLYFNSRPREEASCKKLNLQVKVSISILAPVRRRRETWLNKYQLIYISILAPVRRRLQSVILPPCTHTHFNSRPREEASKKSCDNGWIKNISILAPVRRRLKTQTPCYPVIPFQFSPPWGGVLFIKCLFVISFYFNSRPREEASSCSA